MSDDLSRYALVTYTCTSDGCPWRDRPRDRDTRLLAEGVGVGQGLFMRVVMTCECGVILDPTSRTLPV